MGIDNMTDETKDAEIIAEDDDCQYCFIDKVLTPKEDPNRFPLWVHWTLRIALQVFVGWITYILWVTDFYGHRIYSVAAGLFFVYLIVVLFWGSEIRSWILKEMMGL